MMDSLPEIRDVSQYINPIIILLPAVFDLLFVIILQYLQPCGMIDVVLPLLTDIVNTLLDELLQFRLKSNRKEAGFLEGSSTPSY